MLGLLLEKVLVNHLAEVYVFMLRQGHDWGVLVILIKLLDMLLAMML